MPKILKCCRIPTPPAPFAHSFKMLIFQKMPDGTDAAVGAVSYSYDYDDCTDVEITYGKGKIVYRELYIPGMHQHSFMADALGGKEIATVYQYQGQEFLQWSNEMLQVHCERMEGQPGRVSVYAYDKKALTTKFCMEPILQIQPQARGEDLSWVAHVPDAYPLPMRLILATLPLTMNSQDYFRLSWK